MNDAAKTCTVTRLGECLERIVDNRGRTPPLADEGVEMIEVNALQNGRKSPNYQSIRKYVSTETYSSWFRSGHPKCGDTLISTVGAIGRVAYFEENRGCIAQNVIAIRPKREILNPEFLYYYLASPLTQSRLLNLNIGVAQPSLKVPHLLDLEISIPALDEQRSIAGILSAYDDLIENNLRRIQILEEMARALYREWFVEFRFPGNEKTRLPTIPKDWEITELAKICAQDSGIQTGPFGSQLHQSDYSDEGVPVVMPKDLIGFRIQTASIARIPQATADKLSRHKMQLGDIVYGRRGDIGRRAFIMKHQTGWFCGTGSLRIRPNALLVNGWFLFNYLGQEDVVGLIKGRAQGVTMPNLNTSVLSSIPIRLPPRKLQDAFARLTFPMAEAHEAFSATMENLSRTRDLLLSRLLSGEHFLQC